MTALPHTHRFPRRNTGHFHAKERTTGTEEYLGHIRFHDSQFSGKFIRSLAYHLINGGAEHDDFKETRPDPSAVRKQKGESLATRD